MGFTSYDNMISLATSASKAQEWDFFKVGGTMQGAGTWYSLWQLAGAPGAGTSVSGSSTLYSGSQAGVMGFDPAVSPSTRHIVSIDATATQNCTLMLYDRLSAVSGINLVGTGQKVVVNSQNVTRYTDGVGVRAALEITTATTTTAAVLSMSYTDGGGTTRAGVSVTFPAAATVLNSWIPLPMAPGYETLDKVEAIQVATAPATGVANVVVYKPLVYIPLVANIGVSRDLVLEQFALPRIYDSGSLGIAVLASGTTALSVYGKVRTIYGP